MVSKCEKVDWNTFKNLFDEEVHPALERVIRRDGVSHIVCFENPNMNSSEFGHRTAVIAGPGCTYRTLDMALEGRLGDTPSRFQYPTFFAEVPPCNSSAT